ncbi:MULTISPECIES: hypothetical protein [Tenebrionibacter/Tenebrionicola group]|jgi:hypothetical protein|uniref:Uncharacterized protein n=2 Tax=Tenebrionibacter/Tenebrionicola group TaxID=2969848 RepID=A0A8K0V783_9ENTR|nr:MULTISPECIES: hypothetical protein [Tenebrionibacter/Tenebrionicola group]MBK4716249.1 hypothetical protein [Tenebrionibacter intestinalis]MBV5096904.1 hypothetical protein [Tenebrionicola larvae]
MKFFVRYPGQRADTTNGQRLERRGRLSADWSRAKFHYGFASLPFVSPRGYIYHYQMFRRKADLPEAYRSRWLESGMDADNEPLDFQIIHHDLEHGTEKVVYDSTKQTNEQTNELTN